jgi:DNA-binding MarR family transcriptional regulator
MKKVAEPYELSRTDWEILGQVSRSPGSITELAERIDKSPPVVTESVNRLISKGFVDEEKGLNRRIIRLSERKHAQLLRELLLKYPHVPWQDLLSFSGIVPLLRLELGTISMPISRSTEWRALRNLMSHGIISMKDKSLEINPKFEKAGEAIKEFQNYYNLKLAREASDQAVIVWSKGQDFIVRISDDDVIKDERFKPTATTKMPEYGISLVSNVKFYYYSPRVKSITPEDTVLHTLLTDGVTNTTYALILMAKKAINHKSLLDRAEEYGLRPQVEAMLDFLARKETSPSVNLPTWSEFAEKARDYGALK